VVLLRLQEMQAAYRAPRQRCYATVIAADLLAARVGRLSQFSSTWGTSFFRVAIFNS